MASSASTSASPLCKTLSLLLEQSPDDIAMLHLKTNYRSRPLCYICDNDWLTCCHLFLRGDCNKANVKTLLSRTPVCPGGRIRSRWGCIHEILAVSSFLHNSRTIWRERCRKKRRVSLQQDTELTVSMEYGIIVRLSKFEWLDPKWNPLTHFGSQSKKQFAPLLWTEQVWNRCRHQRHKLIELFIIENVSPLSHLPHCCRKQPQRRYQQP